MTRRQLFDIMRNCGLKKIDEQVTYLKEYLENKKCDTAVMKRQLSHFVSDFKLRWKAANNTTSRFLQKNVEWLLTAISFPIESKPAGPGRPSLNFSESSERTKRQKTESLRSKTSLEQLSYATQMALRSSGQVHASRLLKEITTTTPTRARRYKEAFDKKEQIVPLSGEEALSTMVEAQLTTHQYKVVRSRDPKKFPAYKNVITAKRKCYPENIEVSETIAEVKLDSLLRHTAERLCQVQIEVLNRLIPRQLKDLHLVSKWGMDGSSGQSLYKQRFDNPNVDDSSIFFTSLVPIKLVCGSPDLKDAIVIWQNPRPSSTRYCRPIKMQFVRETTEFTLTEKRSMDKQIEELEHSTIVLEDGLHISVKHRLLFTMIDGKICNAVAENKSTLRCYICKATAHNFHDIDEMLRLRASIQQKECFTFGISILHGWIRLFECLLHLSYKLTVKKRTIREKNDKEKIEERKKAIQDAFRREMGLIVDRPKPGFGNSNDGNTAREFFRNAKTSAKITGIDEVIIERLHVIMQVISSGYDIDIEKYDEYAIATARRFVEKYPYANMSPTVHKFLIHGSELIRNALVPLGQLSEEAQEARNKEIKKFREGFSRKSSRTKSNEDVFRRLLITSDPIITSLRSLPKKKILKFSSEALNLLQAPTQIELRMEEMETSEEETSELCSSDSDSD